LLGVVERQRSKQRGIDEAEDGRRDHDSEPQHRDRRQSEPGRRAD